MSDFNYSHKTKEMFEQFIDRNKVINAYPEMITTEIVSEINQKTNEYIVKQLASLNIDRDVLAKQTEEIQRLRNLCEKAYQQGRADAINTIKDSIHEIYYCQFYCMADMCEHNSPTVDMCIDCFYEAIEKRLEELKEQK